MQRRKIEDTAFTLVLYLSSLRLQSSKLIEFCYQLIEIKYFYLSKIHVSFAI